MPEDLAITQRLVIPAADLELSYSRAGGPGGQKVNKTESRAQLSFDLEGCTALHPALVMACDSHRERSRNVAELRDRLASIIRSCLEPPRPRRATKPSRAAKRRRLDAKKQRGRTKQLRGKVQRDD
jgi:ribosome-associated protein